VRNTLVLAMSLCVVAHAMAQDIRTTIEGKVTATGQAAVVGAVVSIRSTGRTTTTDNRGRYVLSGVASGSQVVSVRAIGWQRAERAVEVPAEGRLTVDFTLEAEAVVLSDLVVSADREARSRTETPVSIGVVGPAEIRNAAPHHPGELVARVAGVWVANLGGEGHMTSIRQPITTKPVYAYLEDGVPIRSTGFFNHNAMYEINVPQADRVEVIKGPGTAVYGSDAIGGVVNVLTRAPSVRPEGSLQVEGGRYRYLRTLGTASNTFGRDGVRADLNLTRSDGFRDAASYQRQSVTLRWDHAAGSGFSVKTIAAFSHIDQPSDGGSELTRADFDSSVAINYTPITFRRVKAARLSSAVARRTDRSLLTATLYGRYNELDIMPSWQLSFDPQIWETSNWSYGLLTRYRRTMIPFRSNLSAGVDLELSPGKRMEQGIVPVRSGNVYQTYTPGETQYDYAVSFRQASPYLQAEVTPIDALHLDLGVRADFVGYDYTNHLSELTTGAHRRPASTTVSYHRLSPKLGAAFDARSWLNLFGSYRAGFRVPSESQLFRQGSATNTVGLAPVKADNYEAGVRVGAESRFGFEGTVYRLDIHDDILTFQDPATGLRQALNAGVTRHRGVELGGWAAPIRFARLDASWVHAVHRYEAWQPSTSLDYSGNEIEMAPRNLGRVALTLTPFGAERVTVTGEWVHQGSYWMDPANTNRYEGFDLGNLYARAPLPIGLTLTARLNNVTNTRYAETTSYTQVQGQRFRPGAPRTFFAGLSYAWEGR
jgi:iron complex outermembrane receptor protein